jgi:hypothetical protein
LTWQKSSSTDSITWEQALNYSDTLTLAGFNDWRLPNIKELQSINIETAINPSLNTTYFPTLGTNKFWSSTTLPNQTTKAWYLFTQFGITTYDFKTYKHYVLCVRGNQNLTVGISKNENENISVYPNPFTSFITIKPTAPNATYELTNSLGQIIFSGKNIQSHDFSSINKGLYFIKIYDNTSAKVLKLIKE